MKISFELVNKNNIGFVDEIMRDKSIQEYISISENFKDYILDTKNVFYYYIKYQHQLLGSLHIEKIDDYITFSLEILSSYQRKGIATEVIKKLKQNFFEFNTKQMLVYIEERNHKSIQLFEKCGFRKMKISDGIIEYLYDVN